jgi:hypothetical protein
LVALQVTAAPEYVPRQKKAPSEVVRYTRDFLMKFVQVRLPGGQAFIPAAHC